jgi:hypothetical protein
LAIGRLGTVKEAGRPSDDWHGEDTSPAVPSRLLRKHPSFGPTADEGDGSPQESSEPEVATPSGENKEETKESAESKLSSSGDVSSARRPVPALVLPSEKKAKVSEGPSVASSIPPLPALGSREKEADSSEEAEGEPVEDLTEQAEAEISEGV